MGYITDYRGRLVCDGCNASGAKKRRCPVNIPQPGGYTLPCCPAYALCDTCFATVRANGNWKRAHESCRARKAQAVTA